MNLLELSIGSIARDIPGSTSVFHKHGLDFCCGGAKALSVMLEEKGIEPERILPELRQLIERGNVVSDWKDTPSGELVAHIKERYHDIHRVQFPELIRLAKRVEEVHKNHEACPTGLAAHLEKMRDELEEHMTEEETGLFPMIVAGEIAKARNAAITLEAEHDDHGRMLEMAEELTNGITTPEKACNTWQALYLGLRTLKVDLMQHIHLENNILFDRLKAEAA